MGSVLLDVEGKAKVGGIGPGRSTPNYQRRISGGANTDDDRFAFAHHVVVGNPHVAATREISLEGDDAADLERIGGSEGEGRMVDDTAPARAGIEKPELEGSGLRVEVDKLKG